MRSDGRARHTLDGRGRIRVESTNGCVPQATAPSSRSRAGECGCHFAPASAMPAESVASIMTTQVLCVRPDVNIDVVAELLLPRRISAVPVVNAAGEPI